MFSRTRFAITPRRPLRRLTLAMSKRFATSLDTACTSIPEGSTGTSIACAPLVKSARCIGGMAAGESTTRYLISFGTRSCQLSVTWEFFVPQASTPNIVGRSGGRRFNHCTADACGSWSINATGLPWAARKAARLVATVVLPQPPFVLSMTTRRRSEWPGTFSRMDLSFLLFFYRNRPTRRPLRVLGGRENTERQISI